jgi:hypothetical protein
MTIVGLISPGLRSALIMSGGLALIVVPFPIGLEAAALTTSVAAGVAMVGLALAGTETTGRGTLPVSAQAVYDRGIAIGLMVVAAIFAVSGEQAAALMFAVAGMATLIVTAATRYSARPA